jgi:hypothetical protein
MTVSEQIIQVINDLCAKFGMVIDWTSENVWPYIESLVGKYIKLEIATSAALCLIFIILPVAIFFVAKYFHPKAKEKYYDPDYFVVWAAVISWLLFVALAFTGIIVIVAQIFDIITCLTFPEKMVFDYIMNLTTSG